MKLIDLEKHIRQSWLNNYQKAIDILWDEFMEEILEQSKFTLLATEYELLYNGQRQGYLQKEYNPSGGYPQENELWTLRTAEQTDIFTGSFSQCHQFFRECYQTYQDEL